MDRQLWVLIGFVSGLAFTAFILWLFDPLISDYDDGGDEPQPNAPASEVRIVIHSPPPKAELHEKLERMVYDVCTEESSSDGGCAICLDEYCNGERRATMEACGHRFHALCVEAWLRENNSCPLCRHRLI